MYWYSIINIWDVIPSPWTNSIIFFKMGTLHHQPVKVCHVHFLPAEPSIAELVNGRKSAESTRPGHAQKEGVLISPEQMVADVYRHVIFGFCSSRYNTCAYSIITCSPATLSSFKNSGHVAAGLLAVPSVTTACGTTVKGVNSLLCLVGWEGARFTLWTTYWLLCKPCFGIELCRTMQSILLILYIDGNTLLNGRKKAHVDFSLICFSLLIQESHLSKEWSRVTLGVIFNIRGKESMIINLKLQTCRFVPSRYSVVVTGTTHRWCF